MNGGRRLITHYMRMLGKKNSSGLESTNTITPPDLSDSGIKVRINSTRSELDRIIKDYLGNEPRFHAIADRIARNGQEALKTLRTVNDSTVPDNRMVGALEAIVRTDGSRPSYLVTGGEPDVQSSTASPFDERVQGSAAILKQAIACVGRINTDETGGFKGTGFLVHENIILTNRHVLQEIAQRDGDGVWIFQPGVHINFGHEYNTDLSNRRDFEKVLFYPKKPAINPIDHSRLDIVVIELKPADNITQIPLKIFQVATAPQWEQPGSYIYTIGYPAPPGPNYSPTLLEQLFHDFYGYKRIAPGEVFPSKWPVPAWTVTHDATTLGGNSGSVVIVAGKEMNAAGIHYGGRSEDENWGHNLGKVLNEPHPVSGISLGEILMSANVNII